MMPIIYEHPTNGYKEVSTVPWLWTLLFGLFYFAAKGIWRHVLLYFVFGIFTLGISLIVYPFLAGNIVRAHYLRQGWRPVQ